MTPFSAHPREGAYEEITSPSPSPISPAFAGETEEFLHTLLREDERGEGERYCKKKGAAAVFNRWLGREFSPSGPLE